MRTPLVILCILLSAIQINAQGCDGQRYQDEIFSVDVTSRIKFGEGVQPNFINPNATQELFLDLYQPAGDTLSRRPLIIWAFGGAFVFGTRLSPDIVTLCNAFASRGYVNASIDYRLTPELLVNGDAVKAYEAIMKGVHDMAASIRYFYKDAATVDAYRIDTTKIFIGGVSAGGFTALHTLHLDEIDEVPTDILNLFIDNGSFPGNSGNPGYSQDVAGVINLCGALGDTAWIDPIGVPIVSLHGDEDDVVPHDSQINTLFGINLVTHGTASIHPKLDQIGTENDFYIFHGAGHTPFVSNSAYMDTTIWFVRDFLYDQVCAAATDMGEEIEGKNLSIDIFPNPAQDDFSIQVGGEITGKLQLSILDQVGREVQVRQIIAGRTHHLDISTLTPGVYLLKVFGKSSVRPAYRKLVVH